jgi:hypothetical protein
MGCNADSTCDIAFIPLIEDPNPYNLIKVNAKVNNSKQAPFILDSGTAGSIIVIDSVFFYNNVDTANLIRVKPKFSMYYWQAFYDGKILVCIGEHKFYVSHIEVCNMKRFYSYDEIYGLIGEDIFLNKITLIDFDENKIAFVDTLTVDSVYKKMPLFPPRVLSKSKNTINQKFVEVDGFYKKNIKEKGLFLFDTGHWPTGLQLKNSYAKDIQMKNKIIKENNFMWRIDSLCIGNSINVNKVPVRKVINADLDRYEALEGGDGLMGMALIKRFNIVLDYKNNMLYLKPNKWFSIKN